MRSLYTALMRLRTGNQKRHVKCYTLYGMANRDFHTMYVGEIVDAYIIFGLQFHPESIMTPDGAVMLQNF